MAWALANELSLLILDELLSKLDSLTRIAMQKALSELWQRQGQGDTKLLVMYDVQEALLLANRIIVFSERPARVKSGIVVDRAYPRRRDDPYLVNLRTQILQSLGFNS